jgi:hypothetical protein
MPLPLDDQQRDRWVSLLGRFNLRLVVQQWETERVSSLKDHLVSALGEGDPQCGGGTPVVY